MLTVAIVQLLKGCYSYGGHWLLSVSIPSSFYLKSVVASILCWKSSGCFVSFIFVWEQ